MLAPVIVFSYNRPNHLRQTLETLAKNDLAQESVLYIFCDGAKPDATEEQRQRIVENRNVAHSTEGFKEVFVVEAPHNKGLANSIIDGVTDVINEYGKVIVLEDDLLTSPFFLDYMNSALDFYEFRPGVMSISANRPPMEELEIPKEYPYDVFVCLRSYSTGWATWKNRWNQVDWSMDYLDEFLKHPEQIEAFNRAGDDMTKMLLLQRHGKIDSWAIRFSFAHFKEHLVAILPCISYVDNIGFDGSGIHSGVNTTNEYRNNLSLSVKEPKFVDLIYEDSRIINAFYNRFCEKKRPLYQRDVNALFRKLGKKPPFVIKKKVYA
jgi:glycosyltransferase involved in cell wall biosynthesis